MADSPAILPSSEIAALALEAGFDAVGFARPSLIPRNAIAPWLEAGFAADMDWIAKRLEDRLDVGHLLPGTRTVIALASNYWTAEGDALPSHIARYARGRDYHATQRDRLRALRRLFRERFPGVGNYSEVDAGPVMEKVWAARAGLGFVGKSGLLITPQWGSWVVLAVMLITSEVDAYHEASPVDRCGSCRLCIEVCPSEAILPGKRVDARRCLSYTTIELEGPVDPALREGHAGISFGCDLCQDVCPLNTRPVQAPGERFLPRAFAALSLEELVALSAERYVELTRGSAVARAGHEGLRRNAIYALGAERRDSARELLQSVLEDDSETVRDAARWALSRLSPP